MKTNNWVLHTLPSPHVIPAPRGLGESRQHLLASPFHRLVHRCRPTLGSPAGKKKGGLLSPWCRNGAMKIGCRQNCESGCWNDACDSRAFMEQQPAPATQTPLRLGPTQQTPCLMCFCAPASRGPWDGGALRNSGHPLCSHEINCQQTF